MSTPAERILDESTVSQVGSAAVRIAGTTLDEIEASLPGALAGDRSQVRAYVAAYRGLADRMLAAVEAKAQGRHVATAPWVRAALEREAMSTPFTNWVGTLGIGKGTAVRVVALLREVLPDAEPLAMPRKRRLPEWDLDERSVVRFYRAVTDELERSAMPLDRIRDVLGLNRTELAALFGVRRQALDQWDSHGVPAERQEKLATLGGIADLLAAKLKADRIPGVVRRAAPAYGGRSILGAIAEEDQESVLAELRGAFDWSAAA